jgi:hypothetical protein
VHAGGPADEKIPAEPLPTIACRIAALPPRKGAPSPGNRALQQDCAGSLSIRT